MSLEQFTSVARATYEAERAYLASVEDISSVSWEYLSHNRREEERAKVIRFLDRNNPAVDQPVSSEQRIRDELFFRVASAMADMLFAGIALKYSERMGGVNVDELLVPSERRRG